MSFDSEAFLRSAGVIEGKVPPEVEKVYQSMTKAEADVLVSLKNRILAGSAEVVAHSEDWSKPQATQEGFDAAMLCACGIWSGSGAVQPIQPIGD